jgi:2-iminobutanoate/2-iminopropanoate deaminase
MTGEMRMNQTIRGILLAAIAVTTSVTAAAAAPPSAEYYPVEDMPASMNLPFSEAVRVGDMLYVSGTVGTDKTGELVAGGITAEAKQVMDNIGAVLQRHGSSFDKVVQCAVALADIKDWPAVNEVYRPYFTTHFPARMAFAATALALGAHVEIQCNAITSSK